MLLAKESLMGHVDIHELKLRGAQTPLEELRLKLYEDINKLGIAAKGGGSENKSKFTVLNPSDSIYDWVISNVKDMGAGWCPPGILGIGIGGNPEKSMLLAKESLMGHVVS